MFDDGTVQILRATTTSDAGRMPVPGYTVQAAACYEERTVGTTRYYNALQANAQVDLVIRIPKTYGLLTGDAAILKPYGCPPPDKLFQVVQVQQTVDEFELEVTDLSLQQMKASAPEVPEV